MAGYLAIGLEQEERGMDRIVLLRVNSLWAKWGTVRKEAIDAA
jgi:hypothetical protein